MHAPSWVPVTEHGHLLVPAHVGSLHPCPPLTLPPLNLAPPQSPGTGAQLADLNAHIQAAAAADLSYERRQDGDPALPCGAAAGPLPAHHAVRSVRLC